MLNIIICIASISPFIVTIGIGIPKVNVLKRFTVSLSIEKNYDEIGYNDVDSGSTNENSNLFNDAVGEYPTFAIELSAE